MRKFRDQLIITISFLTLTSCSVFGEVSVKVAPYKITATDGIFELRQYEKLVLASTDMPDGMESASGPFRRLFSYISGKNVKTEKIQMTAPVLMDQAGVNSRSMSFVLPKDYALLTAPAPIDTSVKITELTNYTVAVITYKGFLNQKTIITKINLLKEWVNKKGLTINGDAKAAGYNPPFTLPFLRRNEIFLPVEYPG
jgi:hypothetical protein